MKFSISIQHEATNEIQQIMEYYESLSAGLGFRFLEEFETLLDILSDRPFVFAMFDAFHRRTLLKRFPYVVYYEVNENQVIISRVRHSSRNNLGLFPDEKKDIK